ncbi:uncharacterized protein EAF01_004430 [Botrytis porri]|uniref:uncharacterized protein n=1 Tax=Botrytis porri TaxID=87229 RepID=UPI0019023F82|nr:uncharacterized protein EAF01_004430 [Botrytis porri]KAF7908675.1 hypothetical protein EAF01_004430 [Botrytis porri]
MRGSKMEKKMKYSTPRLTLDPVALGKGAKEQGNTWNDPASLIIRTFIGLIADILTRLAPGPY